MNISLKKNNIAQVKAKKNWIRYDFTNAERFKGTSPAYCNIGGNVIEGKNWINIFSEIIEHELSNNNTALEVLYKKPLYSQRLKSPFFVKKRATLHRGAKISNGYWVNVNWSIPGLIKIIHAFCLHCGYNEKQIVLYGLPKENISPQCNQSSPQRSVDCHSNRKTMEDCLKDAGLHGATAQELIQPSAAFGPTKNALDEDRNVVAMPANRYIHADSFVDLGDAERTLGKILRTHFAQFGGYSNNQLLFGAACQELSMFLNDNDCKNIDAVYAITRFLFEKKATAGKPYIFSPPHIFETKPDFPMTLRGLIIRLAKSNGGILYAADAKNYLQKTMLSYGSLNQLLQIGSDNTFLLYDDDRYLLSETIGINDAWCQRMHSQIDELFRMANVAYVIPRDIHTAWLCTLPELPQSLGWTRLLLQDVVNKYPSVGFKSLSADIPQSHHTLSAAFVPIGSPLHSFPDLVALFMGERHTLPKRMRGEELRMELRDAGMLKNNEMIYALPKALNDYRFAWTDENKYVYIRGNN